MSPRHEFQEGDVIHLSALNHDPSISPALGVRVRRYEAQAPDRWLSADGQSWVEAPPAEAIPIPKDPAGVHLGREHRLRLHTDPVLWAGVLVIVVYLYHLDPETNRPVTDETGAEVLPLDQWAWTVVNGQADAVRSVGGWLF